VRHVGVEVVAHHTVEACAVHVLQARQLPHARCKGRGPCCGHAHLYLYCTIAL
jgi:hypothetical protein